MSDADPDDDPLDEFDWIARELRPLAAGAPAAFDLLDDAAAIPSRPGFDLIVSKDAIVEGVHFLPDDSLDLVARKLLRVNLSDLAAKGAEPYGYFLAVAWPRHHGRAARSTFVRGLRDDQDRFGVHLLGGDTVSTPGPFCATLTILGWAPAGRMARRAAAVPGDRVLVSGTIGDGRLGLAAAQERLAGSSSADAAWLADRYRLPTPRLGLGPALRDWAHATADISDGLVADVGRIAMASRVGVTLDLERMPLSAPAQAWRESQTDDHAALIDLSTGGDDYELICTAPVDAIEPLQAAAAGLGFALTELGRVTEGAGVTARINGAPVTINQPGYRHD